MQKLFTEVKVPSKSPSTGCRARRECTLRLGLVAGAALGLLAIAPSSGFAQSGGRMMQLRTDTPALDEVREEMRTQAIEEASSEEATPTAAEDDGEFFEPAPNGPGCDVTPASAAVGADVAETYFAPLPSGVNPSFVGPVELLTSGPIDRMGLTVTLPLYRGELRDGRNVFYIVTDTTDEGNALDLGINFAPKLVFADTGRGVREAELMPEGLLIFREGTVDFGPERQIAPGGEGDQAFPPSVAEPGAIGDRGYSPLVKINNAGGHIYNAPIIAFDVEPEEINFPDGDVDYSLVHDRVLAIDPFDEPAADGTAGTVTLQLVPGFSFGRPVLYLSTEASLPDVAAIENNTFAPGLQDITLGFDDALFSAIERLFTFTNGPTGCENPQRQGLSAALVDLETPFNVLGGIPTLALDYSPIWDVNVGEWTADAIESGFRSRLTDEFQILTFVQNGFVTGPDGTDYGSAGFVVNCPIVFRFL